MVLPLCVHDAFVVGPWCLHDVFVVLRVPIVLTWCPRAVPVVGP